MPLHWHDAVTTVNKGEMGSFARIVKWRGELEALKSRIAFARGLQKS
jgi:hypothetical protein